MRHLLSRLSPKHLTYLMVAHFLVGVLYHVFVAPPPLTAEDYDIAQHLIRGEGFSIHGRGPTSAKGPFYPSLLAVLLGLFGDPEGLWVVVFLQQAVCSLHILLLYRLGVAWGEETLAKGAAILFALHPSYLYSTGVMENTLWATAVAIGWGILLFRRLSHTGKAGLLLGFLSGAMFTEKPAMGLLMTVLGLYRLRRPWGAASRYLLGWVVIPLLWSVRGWLAMNEVSLTKNYAAFIAICHSWTQGCSVSPRYTISPEYDRIVDSLFHLPEKEALPHLRRLAIQTILERPTLYVERTIVHALMYWTIPPRYHGNFSLKFIFVRLLPVAVLLVLLFVGAYRLWGYRRDMVIGIGLVLLYYTLFYSAVHTLNIRFKLEIEWLQLYLCAGVFLPKSPGAASRTLASRAQDVFRAGRACLVGFFGGLGAG